MRSDACPYCDELVTGIRAERDLSTVTYFGNGNRQVLEPTIKWTLEPCYCSVNEQTANEIMQRFELMFRGASEEEVKEAKAAAILTYKKLISR